jgi:hypothetical protein
LHLSLRVGCNISKEKKKEERKEKEEGLVKLLAL